jgi:hypothetical protein
VFIAGVYQPPSAYTLSGVTLTFVSAPTAGAGNIIVLHLGNGSATQVPSDGSVTVSKLSSDTYGYINAAFSTANTGSASGSYANSAFLAANTPSHVANSAAGYANSAFAKANSAAGYANSGFAVANSAASYANSAFLSANNGVGVDLTQNTNITNAGTYANSAFLAANSVSLYANSAFAKANTDFTNITISPSETYGNSGYYPVITISANGRINAVSTQVVTDPSAIAFAIALG